MPKPYSLWKRVPELPGLLIVLTCINSFDSVAVELLISPVALDMFGTKEA
jgi:hypothetical protein